MTLGQLFKECVQLIKKASDTPALDARIIAQNVLNIGINSLIIHSQDIVDEADAQKILSLAKRRAEGEPVAYLVGHRGFFEDDFKVNNNTLIPRADTEILVEEALKEGLSFPSEDLEILDLCTGTGCIGISVAKTLKKHGVNTNLTLSDISEKALEVCKENAKRILGDIGIEYEVVCADLFEGVKGRKFDLILSNPPYIATGVIKTLEEQVRREPILALDGGADGLDLIKRITKQASNYLKAGGALLMEIGYDQGPAVKELFEQAGLHQVEVKKDLGQCDRVVKGAF